IYIKCIVRVSQHNSDYTVSSPTGSRNHPTANGLSLVANKIAAQYGELHNERDAFHAAFLRSLPDVRGNGNRRTFRDIELRSTRPIVGHDRGRAHDSGRPEPTGEWWKPPLLGLVFGSRGQRKHHGHRVSLAGGLSDFRCDRRPDIRSDVHDYT